MKMNEARQGFRLSPQQQRLWSLAQQGSPIHGAQGAIRLQGDLRTEALAGALESIVSRQQVLQTAFRRPAGMRLPVQMIGEARRPELKWLNLSELPQAERDARVEKLWREEGGQIADLEARPVFSATLLKLAEMDHLLIVVMSPLCADGGTLDTLVAELGAAYAAVCDGGAKRAPAFPYVQFADWQNALLEESDDELREFWQQRAAESMQTLVLPCQIEPPLQPADREPRNGPVILGLPASEACRLEETAGRCGSAAGVFLLACWQTLLWRLTGQEAVVVADLYGCREESVLADAFGLFAKCLPVTARLQGDLRFTELLAEVGEERAAVQGFAAGFIWSGIQELAGGRPGRSPPASSFPPGLSP